VKARLWVIQGSHPGITAKLMLERKGIPYKLTILPPGFSRRLVKRFGFSGDRTPALKLDGRKIQGSTNIARALDEIQPQPALYPSDPEKRKRVEEAEQWADGVLQQIPRTIIWWAFRKDRSGMVSFLKDAPAAARFGLPASLAVKTAGPLVKEGAKINNSTDEQVQAELAQLPAQLDEVDRLISEGTLNGDELNAADYQIAPSIRLLMAFEDLRPMIEGRPAGALAQRVLPKPAGRVAPIFPAEWLAPLQQARTAG
jgi:glutathione S-transferase